MVSVSCCLHAREPGEDVTCRFCHLLNRVALFFARQRIQASPSSNQVPESPLTVLQHNGSPRPMSNLPTSQSRSLPFGRHRNFRSNQSTRRHDNNVSQMNLLKGLGQHKTMDHNVRVKCPLIGFKGETICAATEPLTNSSCTDVESGYGYDHDSSEEGEKDECPTCLEVYTEENPVVSLQCSHQFHLGCIFEWMERSETCPICGKIMVFDEASST